MAKSRKDNEDQPDKTSGANDDSADNFGLPDIEYKPIERTTETVHETVTETIEPAPSDPTRFETSDDGDKDSSDYSYEDDEPGSKAPVFIVLIIIVVLAVAGFLVYKYWYVPKGEQERKARIEREAEDHRKAEEARIAGEKAEAERKRLEDEAAVKAKPAEGTIETLSERTRRYYVVVTSDIDDDLVMDYAKKLSAKGINSKIIPPFGTTKYYRLVIADFDSFSAAQSSADASKAEYGNGLWVIKY